jgi:hypothetical protein
MTSVTSNLTEVGYINASQINVDVAFSIQPVNSILPVVLDSRYYTVEVLLKQ